MSNKVALVTGSSRGIGKEIALKLANDGFDLVINYTSDRSKDSALSVVDEIKKNNGNAVAIKCNVVISDEVTNMVKEIKDTFGRLDVVVNNAGITRDKLLGMMKEEDFDAVLNVNLKGAFLVSKAVSKMMLKQRYGKIINLSSVIGIMGNAGQSNYAASKAGLIGFTKSLAKELAPRNINVNAIAPGYIETDMTDALPEDVKESIAGVIALKRLGKPEDVANVVSFLASDKADYITGQTINVCGGMVI